MMELSWEKYYHGPSAETLVYKARIDVEDLLGLQLSAADRALMNDVGSDPNASAADRLLVLEMLFRRQEELERGRQQMGVSEKLIQGLRKVGFDV